MEPYECTTLQKVHLTKLKVIHAKLEHSRSCVSWLDLQRTQRLGCKILHLIECMEPLPEHKLTGNELREAREESEVISQMITELYSMVVEAIRASIKRIERPRT